MFSLQTSNVFKNVCEFILGDSNAKCFLCKHQMFSRMFVNLFLETRMENVFFANMKCFISIMYDKYTRTILFQSFCFLLHFIMLNFSQFLAGFWALTNYPFIKPSVCPTFQLTNVTSIQIRSCPTMQLPSLPYFQLYEYATFELLNSHFFNFLICVSNFPTTN